MPERRRSSSACRRTSWRDNTCGSTPCGARPRWHGPATRIFSATTGEGRLAAFEAVLRARLPTVRGMHPAVAAALAQLRQDEGIAAAVRTSGYSHRRFIALFREAVGLTPKVYCRVQRFQRVLSGSPDMPLAALAFDAGYADQPHFTREFRELAGVSPGQYRAIAPAASHHVPMWRLRPTDQTPTMISRRR